MLTLTPNLNDKIAIPLYRQLLDYIQGAIVGGDILPGEKLPSLRNMARSLNISITTVELAYDQLLVEGYISSIPKSGYFVNDITNAYKQRVSGADINETDYHAKESFFERPIQTEGFLDPSSFDFTRWKSCTTKIFNDYSPLLLTEGDAQGEEILRHEISKYVYQSRGVRCNYSQVVIAAGTQELINILCILLKRMEIDHASFENPGYVPVRSIFADRNFKTTLVPIDKDGIQIEKLPANIPSTVYVSPSNQFPTGSIMPAARRYSLLDWAHNNKSIIIEDDYNSELRYDSRPVPSLQGLDKSNLVVYLGSFSSTLFPSIKISYMVLPNNLYELFKEYLWGYVQTCSKAEQLTLALYMNSGFYQTNLRKQKSLNAKKIQLATESIMKKSKGKIRILNNSSGLHMLLEIPESKKRIKEICRRAADFGLAIAPVFVDSGEDDNSVVIFYYTRIPMSKMDEAISLLLSAID